MLNTNYFGTAVVETPEHNFILPVSLEMTVSLPLNRVRHAPNV